ncbi:outer membrane beta-barrel protein [Pedobacter sp. JY14-1]|uniref:outer membrane beta-barrel protein n=1 Tax=Pedobacter sp. JY14-1 TaxID=3034151 RepID=UPI0023E2AFD8|nr:outer membrane beta-barrel protein [Pedobacter sp. JY14-1]
MKKSTKLIASAAAAVALFFSTNANAQSTDSKALRLGVGVNAGVPTTDGYSFVIGGDLRLQKDFSSNVSGLLSAGYNNWSVKDEFGGGSYGMIPVKAGAKVFLAESVYLSGELGAGFGTKSGSKTAFLWAPGVGYGFDNGLDIGLRYEGAEFSGGSLGQVALRVAYGFRL